MNLGVTVGTYLISNILGSQKLINMRIVFNVGLPF